MYMVLAGWPEWEVKAGARSCDLLVDGLLLLASRQLGQHAETKHFPGARQCLLLLQPPTLAKLQAPVNQSGGVCSHQVSCLLNFSLCSDKQVWSAAAAPCPPPPSGEVSLIYGCHRGGRALKLCSPFSCSPSIHFYDCLI